MDTQYKVVRKCSACAQKKSRQDLIKITLEHLSGKIVVAPDFKTFGRSVYVCKNKECVEKFLKKKGVFKGLKISQQKLSQDEYEYFVQSLYEQI